MVEFLEVEPVEAGVGEASDADLARRIASAPAGEASDVEAELYKRLAPRVRLYGLRHLRDEQAAADLTQQVLMITIEGLRAGHLREPEKLASFVLGTCRLVVMDIRRGAHRREQLLREFARDFAVPAAAPIPDIDRQLLARCLEQLAERERSVLVMTFYDEHTSDQVADFLGISTTNVRVIRHRALGRVRTCMTGARP
jgi:RNA polymerase sigma-70 factor (ECF subfamily)